MLKRTGKFALILLLAVGGAAGPALRAQDAADAHWLLEFQGKMHGNWISENALILDKRFEPFVDHYLRMKQTFWEKDEGMGIVAEEFLGVPGSVDSDGQSYYAADGCVPHDCTDKGMLWVDLKTDPAIVVFAATDIRRNSVDGSYRLYLFTSRILNPGELPSTLRTSITRWTAEPLGDGITIEKISQAFIVGPDGNEVQADPDSLGVADAAQEK